MTVATLSSGKWLLHAVGANRTCRVADLYYGSCLNRIRECVSSDRCYEPWMSSAPYSRRIQEEEFAPETIRASSQLDFRIEYLLSIANVCDRITDPPIFDPRDGLDAFEVYTEIEKNEKHRATFQRAFDLIKLWSDWQRVIFEKVVTSIIPICASTNNSNLANDFSTPQMIGALFTSFPSASPYPELSLNISFAHELGHQVLFIYDQSGDVDLDSTKQIYSGIRKENRPTYASLHAAVALAYMIECEKSLLAHETDVGKIAFLKSLMKDHEESLVLGIQALDPIKKTEMCKRLFEDTKCAIS